MWVNPQRTCWAKSAHSFFQGLFFQPLQVFRLFSPPLISPRSRLERLQPLFGCQLFKKNKLLHNSKERQGHPVLWKRGREGEWGQTSSPSCNTRSMGRVCDHQRKHKLQIHIRQLRAPGPVSPRCSPADALSARAGSKVTPAWICAVEGHLKTTRKPHAEATFTLRPDAFWRQIQASPHQLTARSVMFDFEPCL